MAISVSFNGVTYEIPETGEESWGENLTDYFVAIPQGALQKTGGAYTLLADVNFGANFGLLSRYFSTRSSNPSTAGLFRLAVGDSIGWRNNGNDGNLLLSVNVSDQLVFNGSSVISNAITALTGDVTATGPGVVAATIAANAVTDAKFRQSAALSVVGNATNATANVADIVAGTDSFVLRRSGTALAFGLLVNANIDAAAGIVYSKLSLTNSILNADINSSAAIAFSKLAALTINRALQSDGSGVVSVSAVTSTELGYVSGVTSAIQTQLNAKGAGTVTSVAASGPSGIATWSAAVTTSGTLTQSLSNQNANSVLAGPASGAAATPAFRGLVRADIPAVVGARAQGATTTVNNTIVVLINPTESYDVGSGYDNSTGRFTVPAGCAGKYLCQGKMTLSSTAMTAGNVIELYIFKNAGGYSNVARLVIAANQTSLFAVGGSDMIDLADGDIVDFRGYSDTSAAASGSNSNYVDFTRIGT